VPNANQVGKSSKTTSVTDFEKYADVTSSFEEGDYTKISSIPGYTLPSQFSTGDSISIYQDNQNKEKFYAVIGYKDTDSQNAQLAVGGCDRKYWAETFYLFGFIKITIPHCDGKGGTCSMIYLPSTNFNGDVSISAVIVNCN
jgi:hypothetical protein